MVAVVEENRYDKILAAFDKRYKEKKKVNLLICGLIVLLGFTSFFYGLRLSSIPEIFRFMTVDGTVFTTLGALAYLFVNGVEIKKNTELTSRIVYYYRLSCAVAEMVILVVVLFSQLPIFPDHISFLDRYDTFVMHIALPLLATASFAINDSPIGKIKPMKRWFGTSFVVFYAAIIMILILSRTLPHDLIPYFFLDVETNSWTVSFAALVFIFGAAYLMSWFLSELNRHLSWIWFKQKKSSQRMR